MANHTTRVYITIYGSRQHWTELSWSKEYKLAIYFLRMSSMHAVTRKWTVKWFCLLPGSVTFRNLSVVSSAARDRNGASSSRDGKCHRDPRRLITMRVPVSDTRENYRSSDASASTLIPPRCSR